MDWAEKMFYVNILIEELKNRDIYVEYNKDVDAIKIYLGDFIKLIKEAPSYDFPVNFYPDGPTYKGMKLIITRQKFRDVCFRNNY